MAILILWLFFPDIFIYLRCLQMGTNHKDKESERSPFEELKKYGVMTKQYFIIT